MTGRQFVILHHQLPPDSDRPSHWDLMLEHHGQLATWALERAPSAINHSPHPESIPARQLDPHRLEYLHYQGPVSGGRGTVTRYDAGECDWSWPQPAAAVGTLRGQRLHGQFQLTANTDDPLNWTFHWLAQPTPHTDSAEPAELDDDN